MKPVAGPGCYRVLIWGLLLLAVLTGCQRRFETSYPPPPPPAPAPPPVISRPVFYVNASRLNLRACPGMDCPKILGLERNEPVEKLGESEDWSQIRVKRDGTLGWVSTRYLSAEPVSPPMEAPPVAAPPTVVKPPEVEAAPPPPEAPPPPPKKKVEEGKPVKVPKAAEAGEPAPRKPAPEKEKPAPAEEKPAPEKEKPAPQEEPQKRIRIM